MLVINITDCEIHLVIKSAIHFEEIIGKNKLQRHHSGEIGDKLFSIISCNVTSNTLTWEDELANFRFVSPVINCFKTKKAKMCNKVLRLVIAL